MAHSIASTSEIRNGLQEVRGLISAKKYTYYICSGTYRESILLCVLRDDGKTIEKGGLDLLPEASYQSEGLSYIHLNKLMDALYKSERTISSLSRVEKYFLFDTVMTRDPVKVLLRLRKTKRLEAEAMDAFHKDMKKWSARGPSPVPLSKKNKKNAIEPKPPMPHEETPAEQMDRVARIRQRIAEDFDGDGMFARRIK